MILCAIEDPYTGLEPGDYSISAPIPTYHIMGNDVTDFNEAEYYIVYRNNTPTGIFTVNGANTDNPTYSFAEGFVDALDGAVLETDKEYSLIVGENQIFAVTDEEATEIAIYDIPINDGVNTFSADLEKLEYSPEDVMSAVSSMTNRIDTGDQPTDNHLLGLPRKVTTIQVVPNVPSYLQKSGSNWCWAVSAWCVGQTLNPTNTTTVKYCVENVCNKKHGDFGNYSDQEKIFKEVYGMYDTNLHTYSSVSVDDLMYLIDHDEPFIMSCYERNTTTNYGHSVTCYGYKYDPSNTSYKESFAVMDSLGGTNGSAWQWVTTKNGNDYKITSGSRTYWCDYIVSPYGI